VSDSSREQQQAHIEVVARMYEAAACGDLDAMLATFDDDIRIVLPETLPYGGTHQGKAAIRVLGGRLAEAWADFRYDVLHFMTSVDRVAVVIDLRSVARASGREVRMPIVEVFGMRDRLIVGIQAFYFDTAAAARAFEAG
jgi:ketosteroid isomerase-like protein